MEQLDSLTLMQRIKERLVEESQRLNEDVAHLLEEASRLVEDARKLSDQTAAMNERLTALRSLVNDLLNTATLAEGVEYIHRAEQPEL